MSVPSDFDVDLDLSGSLGAIGPLTVAGIPSTFTINIGDLPKIQLGVDPLRVEPLTLNLALKEIPSMRTHLPADFSVGISLLGMELLCIRLCGEAQMLNEPYRPNPCERCGPTLTPVPIEPGVNPGPGVPVAEPPR
ncbi:MAG: hypothetical protein ACKV2U_17345 [Bryobacteraceae bacterium]